MHVHIYARTGKLQKRPTTNAKIRMQLCFMQQMDAINILNYIYASLHATCANLLIRMYYRHLTTYTNLLI